MKTLVYLERNPVTGRLRDVSVELAHKAHALMKPFQGEVVGIYVGDKLPDDMDRAFEYGTDRLLYFVRPDLAHFQSVAYRHVVEAMAKKESPDIVLFGATHNGRELAPLISSSLQTGLTADCTQLYIDDYKSHGKILYQVRPAFGGNILATIITPEHRPMMATVRENVMPLPEHKIGKPVHAEEFRTEFQKSWIKNTFLKAIPKESRVNFGGADVIISGGAGAGSSEGFALVHALAAAMGGEVGASRAAVDFGYVAKDRLIGQTGSVVRPKIYIACGISGSIQHRAGMEESAKIVAINTNPEAPIFKIAHMGIVGDLKEIIPIMIKCIKEDA